MLFPPLPRPVTASTNKKVSQYYSMENYSLAHLELQELKQECVTNEFKYGMIEFRTYETVKPCGLLNIASTIFWVKNQKVPSTQTFFRSWFFKSHCYSPCMRLIQHGCKQSPIMFLVRHFCLEFLVSCKSLQKEV